MLAMESADSIRSLYRHFLSGITQKSLNAFYYACSYARVDYSRFMNITARLALGLMLCVPAWRQNKVVYLAVPLGYRMWQKSESKLELAASMVRQVMPEFQEKKNVIILCDSWYVKKNWYLS